LDDQVASEDLFFTTQVLWQWRTDAPDFTVLAGSCNFGNEPLVDRPGKPYGDRHEIFDIMASQSPDLTLWLGDNLYYREVDYSSREGMAHRWAYERKQPYVQKLLRTGSHASIWDDHDYGPNDSNASFVLKADALDLQKRYWANPSYGLPEVPGSFTTFSFGDADFFMLDNRWYRDDQKLNDPKRAMFGERQIRWLKNALLTSTARFKLIAGGSQFLHKGARGDTWVDYAEEREDFLRFLTESTISGVIFLSGDVHRTELTKIERPGSYPLHDLTCSPMTSGVYMDERLKVRENLVPGTVVLDERNFCHLRFEGARAERRLVLRSIASDGKTQWTHQITAAELGAEYKIPVSTTK
jgi:alkaline phosphatase D